MKFTNVFFINGTAYAGKSTMSDACSAPGTASGAPSAGAAVRVQAERSNRNASIQQQCFFISDFSFVRHKKQLGAAQSTAAA